MIRYFSTVSLLLLTFTSYAQSSHSIVFTGQSQEVFKLDGTTFERGMGTCYDHDQWETQDCIYNSSGEEVCRTVTHGSLTPFSCETSWPVRLPGALTATVYIQSTLIKPALIFKAELDREGSIEIKPTNPLPKEIVMGTKKVQTYGNPTPHLYLFLTTLEDIQKKFLEEVRDVRFSKKSKILVFSLKGAHRNEGHLSLSIQTKKRLFGGSVEQISYINRTNGKFESRDKMIPMVKRELGDSETEFELDLSQVFPEREFGGVNLHVTQTQVFDTSLKWENLPNYINKSFQASIKVK